ncbi:DUF262 domain-containing protein [Bacillus sp. ISL-35]|uniref:DUF262 domain-containing protein n=1 Tax=Bacillus sp. ISL-35 TaxID=2819122 RepID=UPI001BE7E6C4|nr:DUF262 domain-containing protein [Bacillus sp. ISL-35]MBT2679278.1 DUF262 domain-containing protein [Bacillus sp. ISL-35]MBT2703174.1 DUF262 domain-containing protein [Chryseobacterium sp. ISL-80]
MKLRELFEKNDEGKLILPDFQRDFEWAREKQKSLLSSYITQLPVGSLLILEGKKEDFAAKKLCFPTSLNLEERKEECLYLLDGQQRISSLKTIFSDYYSENQNWLEVWEKMYSDLNNRWFIRVEPKKNETDIFGWKNLSFEGFKKQLLEPSEVIDFIEFRRIYKTKTNEWYNPGYSQKDSNGNSIKGNRLKVHIAKKAAEASLIPLYSISNKSSEGEKPLHEYVIEQIKNNRIEELKAAVKDNELDLIDTLEPVDPMISDYIDDEDKVRDAWSTLGAKWTEKVNKYLNELIDQEVPIIQLPSEEISRAISIFENINEGGTDLNTFDLIVAKAARAGVSDEGSLSQRILKKLEENIELPESLTTGILGDKPIKFKATSMKTIVDNKISKSFKEMYLNLLSIFSHLEYGTFDDLKVDFIKRHKILHLNFDQINQNTDIVLSSLIRSLAFLNIRLGITDINKLSYELMILPIAYLLKNDDIWNDKSKLDKIEYWYWASLFGGAYREGQNSQSIKDIKGLYLWVKLNESNKFNYLYDKVLEEEGYSNKEVLLLQDENNDLRSSVALGILQYILSKQPKDFLPNNQEELKLNAWDISAGKLIHSGDNTIELEVHDHHIIPLGDATTIEESSKKIRSNKKHVLNSPLNRTYISSVANLKIRDKSPDKYLEYVNESSKWGHCLPEQEISSNYVNYLNERFKELRKEIKKELEVLQG